MTDATPKRGRYVDHYKGARQQDRRTPTFFFDRLDDRFDFTLDGAASFGNQLLRRYSTEEAPLPWEGERSCDGGLYWSPPREVG